MRKNLKIKHLYKKVTESEVTLTHKGERSSNYFFSSSFTHNQAEQIKRGGIGIQILLEIHQN